MRLSLLSNFVGSRDFNLKRASLHSKIQQEWVAGWQEQITEDMKAAMRKR